MQHDLGRKWGEFVKENRKHPMKNMCSVSVNILPKFSVSDFGWLHFSVFKMKRFPSRTMPVPHGVPLLRGRAVPMPCWRRSCGAVPVGSVGNHTDTGRLPAFGHCDWLVCHRKHIFLLVKWELFYCAMYCGE